MNGLTLVSWVQICGIHAPLLIHQNSELNAERSDMFTNINEK